MRGHAVHLASVEALDDATVRLRTERPTALVLNHLTFLAILPRDAGDVRQQADGTGRTSSSPGRARDPPAPQPAMARERPAVETLVFHTERTVAEAAAASSTGAGRWPASTPTPTSASSRPRHTCASCASRASSSAISLRRRTHAHPGCVGIPNPFVRGEVRRAVSLALDRRALADTSGRATPAGQLVPKAIFGFDPRLVADPRPNLAEARRLLAQGACPPASR